MFADYQKNKVQQREAVENCFDNFVQPLLTIEVPPQPQSQISLSAPQPAFPSLFLALCLWFSCLAIHLRYLCRKSHR